MSGSQDPELSAALGWPGGISDPVLDRKVLLQMVAALMRDKLWEDHRVRHLWDHVQEQAEPVQEPEGLDWRYTARIGYVVKPYTAPPQRTMVPLTEEEIDAEWHELDGEASALFKRVIRKFARAVEKASWEKNHGQA